MKAEFHTVGHRDYKRAFSRQSSNRMLFLSNFQSLSSQLLGIAPFDFTRSFLNPKKYMTAGSLSRSLQRAETCWKFLQSFSPLLRARPFSPATNPHNIPPPSHPCDFLSSASLHLVHPHPSSCKKSPLLHHVLLILKRNPFWAGCARHEEIAPKQ